MQIKNKRILVVGAGISGMASARFLTKRGGNVILADTADPVDMGGRLREIQKMGIDTEIGPHRAETFVGADAIVVSPGVPHTIPPLERARERGVEIIGEIELAYRFIEAPIVGISGTNGKTTTTTLVGEMMTQSGIKTFVGGNIGAPLIDYADSDEKADVVVAEISSFQLDTITSFKPDVGVLLNITQDHLDRYSGFEDYAAAKARLFENQTEEDVAVLNGDDPAIRSLCKDIKGKQMVYGCAGFEHISTEKVCTTAAVTDDGIRIQKNGELIAELQLPDNRFRGKHNIENGAAASLAALAAGGTLAGIQTALKKFTGLSHRLEHVDTVDGIQFFNDSKATNVDAVIRALGGFSVPVVLIIGGRNKGNDFSLLKSAIQKHVKKLIIIGEAAAEIASMLGAIAPYEVSESMADAVDRAHGAASKGDVVLLSPACASFDMFNSYSERGDAFSRAVKNLRDR